MPTADARAAEFDVHRRYLTTVAYRMLGSYADAEDAVQEAWIRLAGTDAPIEDLRAWLVRVVSRVSLDRLRSRTRHPENPLDALPDVETADAGPADRAETADRVGYALMLVLERLSPDERLAYVLHDVFGLPFDDIADAVDRTPQAARKLASRARERVRGAADGTARPHATRDQRRAVVEAFVKAAGDGDLAGLVAVLHPDVEFRIDQGPDGVRVVRGAAGVAAGAAEFRRFAVGYTFEIVALGDGYGVLSTQAGAPASLLFVTSAGDRITGLETRVLTP